MAEPTPDGRARATLAGGSVLGAFGYASMGHDGWHVTQRRNLGGLTEDAVAEGARLIERLAWWPGEPLAVGTDPYLRPRRLAWLGSGATPRRFLVHTIHAENDASARPDNNYTECLVVAPARAGAPTSGHSARQAPPAGPQSLPTGGEHTEGVPPVSRSTRPSQLWAVEGWATPWGAEAVAHARPGEHPLETPRPGQEVTELVLRDPNSLLRLRCLLAAVHRALHLRGPKVAGVVDDLVWGAVLLDTAVALLPPGAAWDATFDLRSLPPTHRFSPTGAPGALVRLHGQSHNTAPIPPDALDLTSECDEARLAATLRHADDRGCPHCGQWHASIDRLLRQGADVTPELLDRQLTELEHGRQRHHGVPRGLPETSPSSGPSEPDTSSTRPPPQPSSDPPHAPLPSDPPHAAPERSHAAPARPSDALRQPSRSPVNLTSWGRGGPMTSRVSRDLDQHGLQEALALLGECRDRLASGPRTFATDRTLREAWTRVRELADSELVRLSADPAERSDSW